MKTLTSFTCGLILLGTAPFAFPAPDSSRSKEPAPPQWNVHGEVLMVAMPQEKLLTILPELRDPQKIDAAVAQILGAVQRKEAILMGYPMVNTHEGIRTVTETILEKRYPTEFNPPPYSQTSVGPDSKPVPEIKDISDAAIPISFETRNTGVSFELEPTVNSKGDSMDVTIALSRVELMGFDSYDATRGAGGKAIKMDQPQFFNIKIQSQFAVRNGQHLLIGVHKLLKPENYMEVWIFQGSATAIK